MPGWSWTIRIFGHSYKRLEVVRPSASLERGLQLAAPEVTHVAMAGQVVHATRQEAVRMVVEADLTKASIRKALQDSQTL